MAAVLIAINWLAFVWAVNNDHKIDASLGYYICPQIIVLLGVVFLKERLRPIQWFAFVWAGVILFMWAIGTHRSTSTGQISTTQASTGHTS